MDQPAHEQQQQASNDERALVARSQQGELRAFNVLVERHQAGAYALALRMLGDPDQAADVTQDAFVSAWRAIGSFHGRSFRSWLLRIVSNGCFDVFRARGRHPSTSLETLLEGDADEAGAGPSDAHMPAAMIDATWDPEHAALRAEVVEAIEQALQRLQPEQRLAIILSDVQGLPYDEVAQIMDTPLGTVKSRIARARGHLRGLLLGQGELFASRRRLESGRPTATDNE
ncbi:MAG TPA: sigma-70 family RNA polymerase sigma factor [Ktedonobacterales bacterium]|jgi:RNA polymerase sigma-70 factor (ECF subfamily)|nr:sigma-70 family RNA polymerase sigma factor [Ktedonobacterales bacterium]